jgi:hypothetical protein
LGIWYLSRQAVGPSLERKVPAPETVVREESRPAKPDVSKPMPRPKAPAARSAGDPANAGGAVYPIRYDPQAKYGALAVIVNQPQDGIVTTRVMDASGREVRILYAGYIEKGTWVLEWDGNLGRNGTARPGDYVIEVQSGDDILKKPVRITAE